MRRAASTDPTKHFSGFGGGPGTKHFQRQNPFWATTNATRLGGRGARQTGLGAPGPSPAAFGANPPRTCCARGTKPPRRVALQKQIPPYVLNFLKLPLPKSHRRVARIEVRAVGPWALGPGPGRRLLSTPIAKRKPDALPRCSPTTRGKQSRPLTRAPHDRVAHCETATARPILTAAA